MSRITKAKCKTCGKDYEGRGNKYCSNKCAGSNVERIKKFSEVVKGKIAWNKGLKGRQPWMDISGLIAGGWNKGKTGIFSEEALEKNRQAHLGVSPPNKGKPMPEAQKKILSDIKIGTHRSETTKKKISSFFIDHPEIIKKRIALLPRGENHHNWKGGISKESDKIRHSTEGNLWRWSVFGRDNFACRKRGIKGGKLVAHHIQNFAQYPELRFAIDNGITLSKKAHGDFHKIYGKKNNTKEQLEEFLFN